MRIDLPLCRHYEYRDFCKWFSDGNCKLNISNCKAVCEKHIDEVMEQLEEEREYSLCDKNITIDMAIEALEKQIPKKPITYPKTNRADCPCCGTTVRGIRNPFGDYCSGCGQKLDWSDEE